MFCILTGPLVLSVPTVSFCQVVTGRGNDTLKTDSITTVIVSDTGEVITLAPPDTLVQDTVPAKKAPKFGKRNPKHSWKTATWMSAVLPGLGQVYNGKWWKVPIVYAALGVPGYFLVSNHINYIAARDAYRSAANNQPIPSPYDIYSADQIKVLRDGYKRNRDLMILITTAVYALNIVDAMVDGHLYKFDVSEDLSLNFSPGGFYVPEINQAFVGVSLTLGFNYRYENRTLRLR